MATLITRKGEMVQDPPLIQALFTDVRAGWLFLPFRLWLGYQWLSAFAGKVVNPKWIDTGEALKSFWLNAVSIPNGKPVISFDWYRLFIQYMLDTQAYTWFAKLVVLGELLVGVALIVGAFTGIAAFFSGFMNWNFMMAGSASTNPMLFTIAVVLILGWKVAGYVGADAVLLRALGTPWHGLRLSNQPEPVLNTK